MQVIGMPKPDGLLPRRRPVDVVERQRHLDELRDGADGGGHDRRIVTEGTSVRER